MSPAPLTLPSNKATNQIKSTSQHLPIKVYSEYLFPLPPTNLPYSESHASRPRSPFPPPYSSLIPPTSPSPSNGPTNNIHHNFIKRSVHVVRRIQPSPDIQQISQCKPLPNKPSVDINKIQQGDNKTWKQSIFRLTPAPTGVSIGDIKDPCTTIHDVNVTYRHELPPRLATSPKQVSPDLVREERQEENEAKEKKDSNIEHREKPNKTRNKSDTSRNGSGSMEEVCENRRTLTSEETLWLHRNYRGEATFLKAWGLHITRSTDRERGLEIMRELMAAESPKGKIEWQIMGQAGKRHEEIGRMKITTPRDSEGLKAIEEEINIY
ncbi:uncharacterized protein GGS22DRAFT_196224 [Annulohypoxylon maeteangense]|uniref:uncharacterized protein n=1 Tax=Annulohypoxylon maeteangense TaxID=1927788 RepID=UPI0020080622|nr:uncharacterized protein GGS22DRAFT_196224 [Annulohypoxylon maeteangense]KAI0882067.1 hypothetical protein GGS22DRAFT_196224 [Annulohypoxylon maeteangense]